MSIGTDRLRTAIIDLKAFVKDDPEDKKAKKKLAKLESKLQVEVQQTNAKRPGLRSAIEATRADLLHAENELQEAVEAKLAYRRQLLSCDSSSEESTDEESDDGNGDSGKLDNGGNNVGGGVGVEVAVPNLGKTDLRSTVDLSAPLRLMTSPGSTATIASQSVVGKSTDVLGNLPGNLEHHAIPPVAGDVHQAPPSPSMLDSAIGTGTALTSSSPKAHRNYSSPLALVKDVTGPDQSKATAIPFSSGIASATSSSSPTAKSTSHVHYTFTTPDRTHASGRGDSGVPIKEIVTKEEVRPLVNCLGDFKVFRIRIYIFISLKYSL